MTEEDRPSIVLTEQCFYSSTASSLWMSSSEESKEGAEKQHHAISTSLYALLVEVGRTAWASRGRLEAGV